MTPDLWEELACIAQRDADAIYDSYAWPPRSALTADERREAERLTVLSKRFWYRSVCARFG